MPEPKATHTWERDPHDWYVEPGRVTAQLLAVERLTDWTHDPCCGQGNIVEALNAAGVVATGSDIVQRINANWHGGVSDFLDPNGAGLFGAPNCVFNPPFYKAAGAEACIRRALELAPGKVCAFVDARFLQGTGRGGGFYRDHPPNRIWVVTPRPSCPPGAYLAAGGKAGNGTSDYLWLVWDQRGHRLPNPTGGVMPRLGWLT